VPATSQGMLDVIPPVAGAAAGAAAAELVNAAKVAASTVTIPRSARRDFIVLPPPFTLPARGRLRE
jgi:hypothetical protein